MPAHLLSQTMNSNSHPTANRDSGGKNSDGFVKIILLLHVEGLESLHGSNHYTRFIRNHGHLPDPEQASTLGMLMGQRVKADDGKLYPKRSKAERQLIDKARADQRAFDAYQEQSEEIRRAIEALARMAGSLENFAPNGSNCIKISQNLHNALRSLIRITNEASLHETGEGSKSAYTAVGYCVDFGCEGSNDN